MIDLHSHTNKSDGSLTPSELVDLAAQKGITYLAVTDHDSVEGIEEAIERARRINEDDAGALRAPEIIPGIEFSTDWDGKDVHVVGLNIDHKNEEFVKGLQGFLDSREGRNKKMAENLKGMGIGISYEGLLKMFPGCVLTRAHFAKYLYEYGYVRSVHEAFERYLGPDSPAYVPREKITPVQAVKMTLSAGGIPVLAHPLIYRFGEDKLTALIEEMKEAGLVGIEAMYSTHSAEDVEYVTKLAEKTGLKISGGSDFHGSNKPGIDLGTGCGDLNIPEEVWFSLSSEG
ncbi:MAG: PHP domain-containing protein [Lachnospiraceae bacterium]|nr:PHP domain-containing protein [Lachnospiraceae bacterium]